MFRPINEHICLLLGLVQYVPVSVCGGNVWVIIITNLAGFESCCYDYSKYNILQIIQDYFLFSMWAGLPEGFFKISAPPLQFWVFPLYSASKRITLHGLAPPQAVDHYYLLLNAC